MEEDKESQLQRDDSDNDDAGSAHRVKSNVSIAETLSLGQEAAFVTVISCAQFTTQFGLGSW